MTAQEMIKYISERECKIAFQKRSFEHWFFGNHLLTSKIIGNNVVTIDMGYNTVGLCAGLFFRVWNNDKKVIESERITFELRLRKPTPEHKYYVTYLKEYFTEELKENGWKSVQMIAESNREYGEYIKEVVALYENILSDTMYEKTDREYAEFSKRINKALEKVLVD